MPNNWKTYKLSEVTTKIGSGATPRGGQEAYKSSGISLIRSQNVLDFTFSTNGLAFIDDEQASKLNNVTIEENDILLNITGDSVARVCKVPSVYLPARVNQHVAIVRADSSILNSEFLKYSLLEKTNKDKLLTLASAGATRNAITKSMIENFEIVLPELQEQKSIASILSAIDDKIENNLAINKTLEEMAMGLYKHWFVDFGPFQDGEFVESELGIIPKGWEVKKFNDLIENIIDNRGKTPPLSSEKTNFLLLETYQLSRNSLFPNVLKDNKAKYVTEEIYNTKKWFRKGHPKFMDILFATVGNGIPNWSLMYENDGVCIAQNIVALRTKENISSFFIRYSFESTRFLDQFDGYVITTAQPSIKLSDLNRINMLLPSLKILKEWDDVVSVYVKQVYNNYRENQTLTQLRDTLLPKLISGEVRLKEFQES
ncbi:restriction endonuclease subunit S [Flavobacterium sp.]|jgi:type I restriction enzyme S subunit|uniref:restriction endonuclease subunit S n=1 Tax=Flavobacterium sp. TaxID=239 RepID=UPI0037831B95